MNMTATAAQVAIVLKRARRTVLTFSRSSADACSLSFTAAEKVLPASLSLDSGIQLKQADVLNEEMLKGAKGLVINTPQRTLDNMFTHDDLAVLTA